MFRQKLKKAAAILSILVLLPYIVTIFVNGGAAQKTNGELKDYCIHILAKEVSDEYEEEMLKAQAILVRTTVYQEVQENGGVLASEKETQELSSDRYRELEEIWDATEGQVLLYENELALVPFHRLSNGKTRSGKETLGSDEYPYLQAVDCAEDVVSELQIESKVIDIKNAEVTKTDSSGYVTEVTVGEEVYTGQQFRDTYELKSSAFILTSAGDSTRVTTCGIGHGLGLSQHMANEMAKKGKNYKEILEYFFAGTEIKEVAEVLLKTE